MRLRGLSAICSISTSNQSMEVENMGCGSSKGYAKWLCKKWLCKKNGALAQAQPKLNNNQSLRTQVGLPVCDV